MIVTNRDGRSFFVRVVFKGDTYGRGDCLTHDKSDPLIEFYDRTYAKRNDSVREEVSFGPRGQFVSRYYASTLADHDPDQGLCLNGGVDAWKIDAAALAPVLTMARTLAVPVALRLFPSRTDR